MKKKKTSPAALARFEKHVAVPGATRALLFGCRTLRINGTLYAMLYGDEIMLRVSPDDRDALLAKGARPFEPRPGTQSKKTLVLPTSITKSPRLLRAWVMKAVGFATAKR